ncbi:MAG: oligoendopeptidase F, partial [Thermomicrobiales bacterium]|nr:oligoendopeptidase F [Thermomicrobiales bacterium]
FERAVGAAIQASQALAFFQPELLQIPEETYNQFLESPELQPFRHALEDAARQRPYVRSIEVETILAQSAEIARTASEAFGALNDADLDFGEIENEEGKLIKLTRSRYQLLMESKNREVRARAYDKLMTAYEKHRNTTGALYAGSVRNDNFYAGVRGYESARAAALLDDNIPESVYDSLVEAVSNSTGIIERYYKLRSKLIGVEDLALYDLYVPLSPAPERTFSIEEAVDTVLGSLTALGDTYTSDLRELMSKRTVDWHETAGKNSGAYSSGTYGANPVILMNWNGSTDHVFTLAHEVGHQMHTFYSQANNPYHYAGYSIFLAEVASTINETLLTWALLEQTPKENPQERFSILNNFADTISGTLIRQTMFADFEHRAHVAAAAGEPLTPESLSEIYGGRTELYRPGVLNDDRSKLEWSRVPHFYRAYYVFQYATGISAALAIASKIRDDGPGARENYLGMLKAGSSDYPIEVLKRGGADLTTPEPVYAALRVFDEMIGEMEALAEEAGFTAGAK